MIVIGSLFLGLVGILAIPFLLFALAAWLMGSGTFWVVLMGWMIGKATVSGTGAVVSKVAEALPSGEEPSPQPQSQPIQDRESIADKVLYGVLVFMCLIIMLSCTIGA